MGSAEVATEHKNCLIILCDGGEFGGALTLFATPFWRMDTEYTPALMRGNLPWLSVTQEPAQRPWRLRIVTEAQQTVRRNSRAHDHTEALPCHHLTPPASSQALTSESHARFQRHASCAIKAF